jgi:subtilisin family serine protease
MGPLDLITLTPLMQRSLGRPQIKVGMIDGPVAIHHPDFVGQPLHEISGRHGATCSRAASTACMHGTFVAGMLSAKRGSVAPAICPNCTLLIRPIFPETLSATGDTPSASPEELAAAVVDTVNAGARVINLSAALTNPSAHGEHVLASALNYASRQGVIVIAAAGNQGTVGSSTITAHPWVIPVVSCDLRARPTPESNLGISIGRCGLTAPGENIVSLGPNGKPQTSSGTSAAAPFVTGTIALLWSEFPRATASEIKLAVTQATKPRRSIVPPLLDAWTAYESLRRHRENAA